MVVVLAKIGQFFAKNWIRLLIAFGIGLAFMTLYNAIQGQYSWSHLEYYRDGSFIAGMILLFMGLLALLTSFGAFNIFSFYFNRKEKENGMKENYTEYSERKKEERSKFDFSFLSYIIIAFAYLLFSVITLIVLK